MKKLILSLFGLFLLCGVSNAATLMWDANPPEEKVVAYRVGDCQKGTQTCTVIAEVTTTDSEIAQPLSVEKCYRVLAVNQYGLTSDWSTEVCVQFTKPSPVNNWRVVLYVPRTQ